MKTDPGCLVNIPGMQLCAAISATA